MLKFLVMIRNAILFAIMAWLGLQSAAVEQDTADKQAPAVTQTLLQGLF